MRLSDFFSLFAIFLIFFSENKKHFSKEKEPDFLCKPGRPTTKTEISVTGKNIKKIAKREKKSERRIL